MIAKLPTQAKQLLVNLHMRYRQMIQIREYLSDVVLIKECNHSKCAIGFRRSFACVLTGVKLYV